MEHVRWECLARGGVNFWFDPEAAPHCAGSRIPQKGDVSLDICIRAAAEGGIRPDVAVGAHQIYSAKRLHRYPGFMEASGALDNVGLELAAVFAGFRFVTKWRRDIWIADPWAIYGRGRSTAAGTDRRPLHAGVGLQAGFRIYKTG